MYAYIHIAHVAKHKHLNTCIIMHNLCTNKESYVHTCISIITQLVFTM